MYQRRHIKTTKLLAYLTINWVAEVLLSDADGRAGEHDRDGELVVELEDPVVDADVLRL